jgi:predicted amidohydrolase
VRWVKALIILTFASLANAQNACVDLFSSRAAMIESMNVLKVAAVQFPLAEGVSAETFLAKVSHYIEDAKAQGSDLVVFPELITTELVDWARADIPQLQAIAKDFTPRYIEFIKEQARRNGISILGGTTPRLTPEGIVNTAVLAMPNGKTVFQDKLFLTPDEKLWGWEGGTSLKTFETPWGKTAILICFDCEFPIISNMLAKERPDVILVPSWTSTESGLNRVDFSARARAVEHYAYVIKTGTVHAETSSQDHFGQASLHTPQDKGFAVKAKEGALNEAQILFGTLDLRALREGKAKSGYQPANEQNLRKKPLTLEPERE